MNSKLPPSASVAAPLDGARLNAPAAARNAAALCDLLKDHAPQSGEALEIASGTGQHVVQFAQALPGLNWQPTDVDPARLASIDAYAAEADLPNLAAARLLDATQPTWSDHHDPVDLIVLINLLHLIPTAAARTLLSEAMAALRPEGRFILYGPFSRAGVLTSAGDQRFDADLRRADPQIGYKDDRDIAQWLSAAGASPVHRIEMPANILAFIAVKD